MSPLCLESTGMSNFLPLLVSLAGSLQVCPSLGMAGLFVAGNEILDTEDGTLYLVEDVLLTELVPSIIVQMKKVSPSSAIVQSSTKCYKLQDIQIEDMIQVKAVLQAVKPYKWSVPHWLSVNQLDSLLTTGEWLKDWDVPVQPTR